MKQIELPKVEPENYEQQEEKQEKREKREKTPKTTPEKKIDEIVDVKSEEKPKSAVPLEVAKSEEIVNEPDSSPLIDVTAKAVPETLPEKLVEKVEKPQNDKPRSSKSRKSHSKHESEKVLDGIKSDEKLTSSKSVEKLIDRSHGIKPNETAVTTKPPRTAALRSAAVRPISARPSAPRRRDRNVRQIIHTESFVQESGDQKADKKNLLPEFDDADNIVITETIADNLSAIDEPVTNNGDGELDGKQGHLVQQILETQTAILKSDAKNDTPLVTHTFFSFWYIHFKNYLLRIFCRSLTRVF